MKQQTQDWKDKYYEAVKELDQREQDWRRIEHLLRSGINRLAMLSQDGHQELDRSLHKIRTLAHGNNNIPALEQALSSLTKADDANLPSDDGSDATQAIQTVSSLLPLKKEQLAAIDTLCQKQDAQSALKLLIQSITRLFKNNESIDNAALAKTLLSLLTQLEISETESSTLTRLQQDIAQSQTARQWQLAIEKIIDQVRSELTAIHTKKNKLLLFIKQLSEQLGELEKCALSSAENMGSAQQRAKSINGSLSDELTTLSNEVVESEDLGEIKQKISHRLSSALKNMQDYFAKESDYYSEAKKNNQNLLSQLRSAKSEVTELRAELAESKQAQRQDKLTGVANRYAYDERADMELARHQRAGKSMIYALWDIDHFKSINDNFGHIAGDIVLKMVAQLLQKSIRTTDFMARIGGEEFAMLLPESHPKEAQALLDKIRQTIESSAIKYKGNAVKITASCGYTGLRAGDDIDTLYERADAALYRAKRGGRNQCVGDGPDHAAA